jgi:2-polyprenyl-3-methyl-5-hydroxy-6-metoxy-1,4-benzoquinol methylase
MRTVSEQPGPGSSQARAASDNALVAATAHRFACRICGNSEGNKTHQVPELMYGLRNLHVYEECARCGCLQIAGFPDDIERYYGPAYYSYQSRGESPLTRALVRARDAYAMLGTGWIGRLLKLAFPTDDYAFLEPLRRALTKDSRILDVGCGSGHLLKAMQRVGFSRLDGIDPFGSEDRILGPGLTIRKCYIEDLRGTYDLVMFHHSLEHVPDQSATLQNAYRLLVPGGFCVVRVPSVSSYAWRQYGIHWVQLDAPRHYYLHSDASMRLLAETVGFEVTGVVSDSSAFQFWGSEQYARGIALMDARSHGVNPRASMFSRSDIARFKRRARKLNATGDGDQRSFYLRKPLS